MKASRFLQHVSDEQGPLITKAIDLIEIMSNEDFQELCTDMENMIDVIRSMAKGDQLGLPAALLKFPEIFK